MGYDVTNLVNNVILPQAEPNDIIGMEYIKYVTIWSYLPTLEVMNLAIGYRTGAFLSIILLEGQVFIGTGSNYARGIRDVKRIAERIEAHESTP